jgi:hypothetical protein
MNKRDWTITFNDGSTATYFNMSSLDAVNTAVNDWLPAKHPVAWHESKVDLWEAISL